MTIDVKKELQEVVLTLAGRLDTTTAPQLEAQCKNIGDCRKLVMDFAKLEYVSSAGLRVILGTQKAMAKIGSMVIKNVNETIMEVFEVTGFAEILTIERA